MPHWRDVPHVDHQTDCIIPNDSLVCREWFCHGGPQSLASSLKFSGAFYSQPGGWKYAIDCIGKVP
jgi:hypothetical protein